MAACVGHGLVEVSPPPLLIGREHERAALLRELREGARFVTLTAPAGFGKTALALQVAHDAREHFPGGVVFGRVSDLSDPGILPRALGLGPGDEGSRALASRAPTLLALDGVEELAPRIGPQLERWLAQAPDLRILTTSLVPVGSASEHRYELGPLSVAEATELYLHRARRAWCDRGFTDEEMRLVERLVTALDCIPLAVELAGDRIRILSPGQLLTRLDQRFEFLSRGGGGRRDSLEGAFDATWRMLRDEERVLLKRISVFAASFSLDAAVAVLGEEGKPNTAIHEALDRLRERSLLLLPARGDRFRLYECIRLFAIQRSRRSELRKFRERHLAYYLDEAERRASALDGPSASVHLAWLAEERANLLAAFRHAQRPAGAARLGLVISRALQREGALWEDRKILREVERAARRSGDPRLLGRALIAVAEARLLDGGREGFDEHVEEALELARTSSDSEVECRALVGKASRLSLQGKFEEAEAMLRVAKRLAESEGLPRLAAYASLREAANSSTAAKLERAVELGREVQRRCRKLGHLRFEAIATTNLSLALSRLGRHEEARREGERARELFSILGDKFGKSGALANLAARCLRLGEYDAAERFADESMALAREMGTRRYEASSRGVSALVAFAARDLSAARERLLQGERLVQGLVEEGLLTHLSSWRGIVEVWLGRVQEGRRLLESSKSYYEGLEGGPLRFGLLQALADLGEARLHVSRGRVMPVAALVQRARRRLHLAESPPPKSAVPGRIPTASSATSATTRGLRARRRSGRASMSRSAGADSRKRRPKRAPPRRLGEAPADLAGGE